MESKQVEEMSATLVIVATFLGRSVIELGKCFAEPIKRQFNYFCCFSENVETLVNEATNLEGARVDLQMRVQIDERNAQVVDSQVKIWLEKVSEIQEKMHEIDSEITTTINGCAICKSRFSLSKKVKKIAEDMKELRQSGNFNTVSQSPPPAASVSIPLRSTFEFESRKQIEEEIMADLKDIKANVLGICGMGGVGKTTMVKRIMDRVRKELGFEETVIAIVSQEVDMMRIQDDIAKSLGLKLEKNENISSKAHMLHTRLTAGRYKSLIVLDDIWENIKLEDLGIPCNGDGGCKVLLTSRDKNVVKSMSVEKVHVVPILSNTEAWDLFKSNAGSCIEQENVVFLAHQIVKECKGLPIALVTVGKTLKETKITSVWKDWLLQLKSSNPGDLPNVLKYVYKPLRLSYDILGNGRAQSLFLLCCLFPEDYNIPLERLSIYAMGLCMFEGITSLEQVRNRVCSLVEMLKDRFLLQEGFNKNHVKMHDVIRDVAIYIASDEKRINCNDCTWISPSTRKRITTLTSSGNLHLLLIDRQSRDKRLEIDDHFFKGMCELNVFSIEWELSMRQLPQTTALLRNLRTLILEYCVSMEKISVIGLLCNLEILICRDCATIDSLPVEMKRLNRLRLLELSRCRNLKTIAPGIISNLKKLEELIVEDFGDWESEITGIHGENASLSELQHLSYLTRLKIQINDSRLAAEEICFPPNMVKYDITVGCERRYFYFDEGFEKIMILKLGRNKTLAKWIHECVRSVECTCIEGYGLKNVDFGFAHNMRSLTLKKCLVGKKLVNTRTSAPVFPLLETLKLEEVSKLEVICDTDGHGPYQPKPVSIFNKLSSLHISKCHTLQSLFSLSLMATGSCLARLEWLDICDCEMMEQVFLWNEKEISHTTPLVFPKLKFLSLETLPMLRSFCKGTESVEFPVLVEIKVKDCPLLKSFRSPDDHDEGDDDSTHFFCNPQKVKFGCLSKLSLCNMKRNLCRQIPSDFFGGLCELRVSGLKGKSLFSLSKAEIGCYLQLEKLEIRSCDMMEQVMLCNDEDKNQRNNIITILPFPKLKWMSLHQLPMLTSLSKGIEFLLPAALEIRDCPKLLMETCVSTTITTTPSHSSSSSSSTDSSLHLFCKPRKVGFGSLREVSVGDDDSVRSWCGQIPVDFFTGLCKLWICRLTSMKSLFPCSVARNLVNVRDLRIEYCQEMVRVIEDEEGEDDDVRLLPLFPNLEYLNLHRLRKLNRFCGWRRPLQLPSLTRLHIHYCDLMDKFSLGSLDTPKLYGIEIDHNHYSSGQDLNTVLQKHRLCRKAKMKTKT